MTFSSMLIEFVKIEETHTHRNYDICANSRTSDWSEQEKCVPVCDCKVCTSMYLYSGYTTMHPTSTNVYQYTTMQYQTGSYYKQDIKYKRSKTKTDYKLATHKLPRLYIILSHFRQKATRELENIYKYTKSLLYFIIY